MGYRIGCSYIENDQYIDSNRFTNIVDDRDDAIVFLKSLQYLEYYYHLYTLDKDDTFMSYNDKLEFYKIRKELKDSNKKNIIQNQINNRKYIDDKVYYYYLEYISNDNNIGEKSYCKDFYNIELFEEDIVEIELKDKIINIFILFDITSPIMINWKKTIDIILNGIDIQSKLNNNISNYNLLLGLYNTDKYHYKQIRYIRTYLNKVLVNYPNIKFYQVYRLYTTRYVGNRSLYNALLKVSNRINKINNEINPYLTIFILVINCIPDTYYDAIICNNINNRLINSNWICISLLSSYIKDYKFNKSINNIKELGFNENNIILYNNEEYILKLINSIILNSRILVENFKFECTSEDKIRLMESKENE